MLDNVSTEQSAEADVAQAASEETVETTEVDTSTAEATEEPVSAFAFPGEDASQEDVDAFDAALRERMGVPDSADGYEIGDLPEGWTDDEREGFLSGEAGITPMLEQLHEMGAKPEVAQAVAQYMAGAAENFKSGLADLMQGQVDAGDAAIKEAYGDEATDALTRAGKQLENMGVNMEEVMGAEGASLAQMAMPPALKVAFVRALDDAFQAGRNPTVPAGSNGAGVMTRADAEQAIQDMYADPETQHKLRSGDPAATRKLNQLEKVLEQ